MHRILLLLNLLSLACSDGSTRKSATTLPAPQDTLPSWRSLELPNRFQTLGQPPTPLRLGHHRAQVDYFFTLLDYYAGRYLETPAHLIEAASQSSPQPIAKDTVVFSFRASVEGLNLATNLRQEHFNEKTSWLLQVTSLPVNPQGCCEEFSLVRGSVQKPNVGSWEVYDIEHPKTPIKMLSINYDFSKSNLEIVTIQIDGQRGASERLGQGSLIIEERNSDVIRRIVKDSAEYGSRNFIWSRSTLAGSYTAPDGRVVCWGPAVEGFPDSDCTNSIPIELHP